MFSSTVRTRSALFRGPPNLTKPFVFEAAIHWAEQGQRVVYITPAPLQSLPATYHDRNALSTEAFKLMRFMYLENYETLVHQLVDLHNFHTLPSALLIDDLDAYADDPAGRDEPEVHVARLLALVLDSANACSRIIGQPINLCVACSAVKIPALSYFREEWSVRALSGDDEGGSSLRLSRSAKCHSEEQDPKIGAAFDYEKFNDGTLVLRRITGSSADCDDSSSIDSGHLTGMTRRA